MVVPVPQIAIPILGATTAHTHTHRCTLGFRLNCACFTLNISISLSHVFTQKPLRIQQQNTLCSAQGRQSTLGRYNLCIQQSTSVRSHQCIQQSTSVRSNLSA